MVDIVLLIVFPVLRERSNSFRHLFSIPTSSSFYFKQVSILLLQFILCFINTSFDSMNFDDLFKVLTCCDFFSCDLCIAELHSFISSVLPWSVFVNASFYFRNINSGLDCSLYYVLFLTHFSFFISFFISFYFIKNLW